MAQTVIKERHPPERSYQIPIGSEITIGITVDGDYSDPSLQPFTTSRAAYREFHSDDWTSTTNPVVRIKKVIEYEYPTTLKQTMRFTESGEYKIHILFKHDKDSPESVETWEFTVYNSGQVDNFEIDDSVSLIKDVLALYTLGDASKRTVEWIYQQLPEEIHNEYETTTLEEFIALDESEMNQPAKDAEE